MKKLFYSLICLLAFSSCSSEQPDLDTFKVYDLTKSECKLTPAIGVDGAFDEWFKPKTPVFDFSLNQDGVLQGKLEDIRGNCSLKNILVNVTGNEQQLIFAIAPQIGPKPLADCYCYYDVSFKASKIVPGKYRMKIYYANTSMEYDESDLVYNDELTIEVDKRHRIELKSGMTLSEN